MSNKNSSNQLYDLVTGDEDARVCKDIPDEACHHLPYNFFAHLNTQLLTKLGDELASAKLMFPWVLSLLGAPLLLISLCVPIREAGVLIPQLFVAAKIRLKSVRKHTWAVGSLLTAFALIACSLVLMLNVSQQVQTAAVFASLCLLALARGICSVASKDVMGKTVSKSRRGTLTGLATSLSGLLTLGVGLGLIYYPNIKSNYVIIAALFMAAGLCWVISTLSILSIRELPGATENGANGIKQALKSMHMLVSDSKLRNFVLVRTLLLSVPLSIPVVVVMAQQAGMHLGTLGYLVLATGSANFLSGYIWGRLADISSRKLLILCGLLLGSANLLFDQLSSLWHNTALESWLFVGTYFVLSVILAGVRTGRKTLLVDMADSKNRATYVAVSNTVIGVMIIAVGASISVFSGDTPSTVLLIFSGMGILAALFATFLLPEIN